MDNMKLEQQARKFLGLGEIIHEVFALAQGMVVVMAEDRGDTQHYPVYPVFFFLNNAFSRHPGVAVEDALFTPLPDEQEIHCCFPGPSLRRSCADDARALAKILFVAKNGDIQWLT